MARSILAIEEVKHNTGLNLEELEAILQSKGHTNMLDDGRGLVNEGITSQEELYKVCGISADDC